MKKKTKMMKIKLLIIILILLCANCTIDCADSTTRKRTNSKIREDEHAKALYINKVIIASITEMVKCGKPTITNIVSYLIEKSYEDGLFDLDDLAKELEAIRNQDNDALINDLKGTCISLKGK